MTAVEPLDPEVTEPAEWEPWDDYDWLTQDDDGTAEADRWRRVRTIEPTGGVL